MLAALTLSACDGGTTTIIREVPAGGGASDAATSGTGATRPTEAGALNASTPGATTSPAGAVGLFDEPGFTAPTTGVSGLPGEPVECAGTLPCRWVAADQGSAITVVSVDHLGDLDALTLDFSVEASRDTAFAFTGASPVPAAAGGAARASRVALGDGNGIAPVGTVAGSSLRGRIAYEGRARDTELADWALSLDEAGQAVVASFAGLPIGSATGVDVDCALTLPCSWQSEDGGVIVTLTRAGGFATARRLDVGFVIESATLRQVMLEAGSTAVAASGYAFEARTHALDGASGFAALEASLAPGTTLTGRVDFYRSELVTDALAEVRLELFEDAAVPRWRPGFLNVPSVAP